MLENQEIWYHFTTTTPGQYVITAKGNGSSNSGFDMVIELRSNACNGSLITGKDATGSAQTEVLTTSSLASGVTYKIRIYDYNCNNSDSRSFTIKVDAPPCAPPTVTSTTPGTRGGSGTVVLGATVSAGTANWYAAATGGSPIGTGTSFTTPEISATTTFYVGATDYGCTGSSRTPVTAVVLDINALPLTGDTMQGDIVLGQGVSIAHATSDVSLTYDALGTSGVVGLGYNLGNVSTGKGFGITPPGVGGYSNGRLALIDNNPDGHIVLLLGTIGDSNNTRLTLDGLNRRIILQNDGGDRLTMGGVFGNKTEWETVNGYRLQGRNGVFNGNYIMDLDGKLRVGSDVDVEGKVKAVGGIEFADGTLQTTAYQAGGIQMVNELEVIDKLKVGTSSVWIDGSIPNPDAPGTYENHLYSTPGTNLYIQAVQGAGKVGIGTNDPAKTLHILSKSLQTGSGGMPGSVRIENVIDNGGGYYSNESAWDFEPVTSFGTIPPSFRIGQPGSPMLTLYGNDGIGIGTIDPIAKLHIHQSDASKPVLRVYKDSFYGSGGILLEVTKKGKHPGDAEVPLLIVQDTGNVGIGTINPTAKLHVDGGGLIEGEFHAALNNFNVMENGLVGIGTTNPSAELHRKAIPNSNCDLILENAYGHQWDIASGANNSFAIYQPSTEKTRLVITDDGKVGIGTDLPQGKLHVFGKLHIATPTEDETWTTANWKIAGEMPIGSAWRTFEATPQGRYLGFGMTDQGWYWLTADGLDATAGKTYPMSLTMDNCGNPVLRVLSDSWCDFVFDENYQRQSFEDQERFYKTNKHLKGIPSESQVLTEGLDIIETMRGLTFNVEESRLDMLDLYKMIQAQNQNILKLQEEVLQLRTEKQTR